MDESKNSNCEECKNKSSKYKCPACCLRTCSLVCVKAHKQRTGCNGTRNITSVVPLSQFDDKLLLSDYNLLQETKRAAENAERIRSKLCNTTNNGSSYPHHHLKLPYPLKTLRNAAASRRTKLWFLPSGMSKRETNQTRFNKWKKYITWTIEWRFHSTDVILVDHGVHENTSLCSLIENHLQPSPWNHPLRRFCEEQLDCLKFFIQKYPKGSKSPFRELDIKAPIRQQLADIVVLEYPVIHVFLPSAHLDFEVIKENCPITHRTEVKDSSNADNEMPKGVTFKEEEIKENGSSLDPQVFDLLKHVKSISMHQIPSQNNSAKASGNADLSLSTRAGTGNSVHSSSQAKDSVTFEDMDFNFDQGLIDTYSGLIAENNPDDFLNSEAEFDKQSITEDRRDLSNSMGVFFAEEVEEGEIVD